MPIATDRTDEPSAILQSLETYSNCQLPPKINMRFKYSIQKRMQQVFDLRVTFDDQIAYNVFN